MKRLVATMQQAGFVNVSTYINSGNIFFDDSRKTPEIKNELEHVISDSFALNIPVLLRTKAEIQAVVDTIPKDWTNDEHRKTDILFLWDEYRSAATLSQFTIKPGIDTAYYADNAIVWMIDRKHKNKSGLLKLPGTQLYKYVTIRNVNTLRTIAERL